VADDIRPPLGDVARTGERVRSKDDVFAGWERFCAVDRDALPDCGKRNPAVQLERTDFDVLR
jgi:hypothetical protein